MSSCCQFRMRFSDDSVAPQNCGFGGPGKAYLYVTGRGAVWRVKTLNAGVKNRGK